MEYTLNQQKAIEFKNGNLQIIACAGSGKTDVITRRIAKLILEGTPPSSILAFTFTEKAAEEMKFRIRKHLQELRPENPEIGEMYVGTIHSFCFELLKRIEPEYKGFDVIDTQTRMILLSNNNNFFRIGLNRLDTRSYRNIDAFCRSVDLVREEMIDTSSLTSPFKEVYENYIQFLKEEHLLDFSGMMYDLINTIESDFDIKNKVQDRYEYVIVDEYQDINSIQEKIIRLILGDKQNLCAVGDDDQCIYQWRGSNVRNILTFSSRYQGVNPLELSLNFRSSEGIVNSAKSLIQNNRSRLAKNIHNWPEGDIQFEKGDIYKIFFDNDIQELNFVLDKIEELRGTSYINNKGEEFAIDYRDIAILFRSVRTSAELYLEAFRERGIPYIVKGGGKLFEQNEITLVIECLAYLGNFELNNTLVTMEQILRSYNSCFNNSFHANIFSKELENLKNEINGDTPIKFQEFYQRILNYMGASIFEFSEVQYYNLGKLSQVISDFESVYQSMKINDIRYFLGFIRGYGEWNYEEGGTEDPTKINAIKITTIHQVKGLEFPIVFMPNLVSGRFPSTAPPRKWYVSSDLFDIERFEANIEDERRLFYVGITRSEKYLFITGSEQIIGLSRAKNPSIFFEEFPDDYALTSDIKDPTNRKKIDLSKVENLKGFPTSYSELRYYDRCPYDYKLRFIFGFNPEISTALGYGKCIHNILNIIHSNYKDKKLNDEEIFELIENNFYLRYAPKKILESYKKNAESIIYNYMDKFCGDFNRILESEKSFEFAIGDALISGNIDLIKKIDSEGKLEGIEIVDFKNHEDNEMAIDYQKQLKLYAIASIRSLDMSPKKAVVHNLDQGTITEIDISTDELKRIEKEVDEEVKNIMQRNFPKYSERKKCKICDWRYICPKEV